MEDAYMKRAVLVVAVLIGAAFVAPASRTHGGVAVAATPTPAALQYDEINRFALPPATPPPPGSFASDYQALLAAGTGGGEGPGLPPAARKMMLRMKVGALTRYTYYKGWIRTDDPIARTAVIEKCQEHQYISLDLAKKTYTITTTQPACPPAMPEMASNPMSGPPQAQPGSVDITMSGDSKNLGPLSIDGIATVGSDNKVTMAMTNATGSCQNGSMSMAMTKYVSEIRVPRPYCPLPQTLSAGGAAQRNAGCLPRMHYGSTGNAMDDKGRLVMYSLTNTGSGRTSVALLIERGNVKWFGGADAEALFAIPPDFSKSG
jgi:hypothetical protein